jgi:hypothetical protein
MTSPNYPCAPWENPRFAAKSWFLREEAWGTDVQVVGLPAPSRLCYNRLVRFVTGELLYDVVK